ncbi:MAG: hypothetical protein M1828_004045 [Chrysothrix sp. TS-e1954]|nr:MAG: hypothetical protein M1828_004045 [Chrysothrix sp. TS-e1954]
MPRSPSQQIALRNVEADHALEMAQGLIESFDNPEYSDLIIRCKDTDFRVHKVIVCQHSRFFKAACEHDMKEKKDGIVEVHDIDPEAVKAVLSSVYCKPYKVPSEKEFDADVGPRTWDESFYDDIMFHIDVHAAAVQLNFASVAGHSAFHPLRLLEAEPGHKLIEARFQAAIDRAWASVPDKLPGFPEVDAMRDALVRMVRHWLESESAERPVIRGLLTKNQDFAQRLALNQVDMPKLAWHSEYHCELEDASCAGYLNGCSAFFSDEESGERGPWCPVHDCSLYTHDYSFIRNKFLKEQYLWRPTGEAVFPSEAQGRTSRNLAPVDDSW